MKNKILKGRTVRSNPWFVVRFELRANDFNNLNKLIESTIHADDVAEINIFVDIANEVAAIIDIVEPNGDYSNYQEMSLFSGIGNSIEEAVSSITSHYGSSGDIVEIIGSTFGFDLNKYAVWMYVSQ